ncbi:hypothetical protein [Streptomyces leeuwenhoekii]|uniref:hypothetical protein n=1 Tax=Streptomyces leeuwenhoekii TaxID=1437453 RepID=UPI000A78759A|nr:hypothetical protein [Streptomyces leeuwenhoekii]
MIRHAIPYAGPARCGHCPLQVCGGILPDPDCPDHGARREPAMEWHEADGPRCQELRAPSSRYRCDRGHLLPADFRPPATDPDNWVDECRCKPAP